MVWLMRCLSLLAAMGLASAKGLKAGTILWFDLPACPSGWETVSSTQGRLVVGADTSRTIGATVGDALTKDEIERGDVGMHSHEFKQGAISVTFEEAGAIGVTIPIPNGGTFGIPGTKNSARGYTPEATATGFSFADFQLCALKEDSPSMEIPARSIHFREDDECGEGWEKARELMGRTLAATSGSESQLSPNILDDQEEVGRHSHDFTYEGWEWDGGGLGVSLPTNIGPAARMQDPVSGTLVSEPSTMNIPYTQLLVCEKSNSAELAPRPTAPPEGALSFRGVGEVTCGDGWKRAPSKYSEKLFVHGFERQDDPYEPGGSRIIGAEESTLTPVHVHSGSKLEINVGEGGTVGYANAVFVLDGAALRQFARANVNSMPLQQTAEWIPADTVAFPYAALVMCTPCAAGFMCDDGEERACDAGYFCPPGSSTQTKEIYHCRAGSWSDTIGAKNEDECSNLPCDPGYWCPTGSTSPKGEGLCPAGYFCAPFKEKVPCQPGQHCPEGTSVTKCLRSSQGAGVCSPGFYCPNNGEIEELCNRGYKCEEGSTTSTGTGLCPAGEFCEPGKPSRLCNAGRWCGEGAIEELETDAGYWSAQGANSSTGSGVCEAGFFCRSGTTQDEKYLNPCPEGKYCKEGTTDGSEAPPCRAGHYCPSGTSEDAMLNLYQCPRSFYCPEGTGATPVLCPDNYECGLTNGLSDGCKPFYYMDEDMNCVECPEGLTCEGGFEQPRIPTDRDDWTFACCRYNKCPTGWQCSDFTLSIRTDYWRSGTHTDILHECPFADVCLGGVNASCAEGNEGVLCASCAEGFYRRSGLSECEACGSKAASIGVAVLIVVAMVIALFIFILINRRAPNGLLRPFILLLQLFTVMLAFNAPFPDALVKIAKAMAALNIGLELSSPKCAGLSDDYYSSFGMMIASLFLVVVATITPMIIAKFRRGLSWDEALRTKVAERCFRDLFVIVILFHPPVSGKAMQFFRCREIEGESYLMADYSLKCYDSTWYVFLALVLPVLLLFSAGTPFVIAYVLYTRSDQLYDKNDAYVPQPLDILYAIYRKGAYWFESVQMAFKLALWSTLVFFGFKSAMQLATALVINVLQLCVHIYVLPMGGENATLLNNMQTAALVLVTYINFGGLVMNYLEVSQRLAMVNYDDELVSYYERLLHIFSVIMQILTYAIFAGFGIVGAMKLFETASTVPTSDLRSRLVSVASFRLSSMSIRGSNSNRGSVAKSPSLRQLTSQASLSSNPISVKGSGENNGTELSTLGPSGAASTSMSSARPARQTNDPANPTNCKV